MRLLLEDVTLVRRQQIDVHIRFRGGVTQSLTLTVAAICASVTENEAGRHRRNRPFAEHEHGALDRGHTQRKGISPGSGQSV